MLVDWRTLSNGFPILTEAARRFKRVSEVRIRGAWWRVRDTGGGGLPLVLLPGSLGTAEIFSYQIVGLSDRYRCLAVDYPDRPSPDLARDLVELLVELDVARASILGASLAGYWLQFIQDWSRIDRLVLASTFCDSEELRHHPLFDIERLQLQSGHHVKTEWLRRLDAQPRSLLRDIQIGLLRDGQDGEQLRKRLLAAATAKPAPTIEIEEERIGLIGCEDDPLLFPRTRGLLFNRYSKAQRLCLSIGGHYPHVTQFERYNGFLTRMLSSS